MRKIAKLLLLLGLASLLAWFLFQPHLGQRPTAPAFKPRASSSSPTSPPLPGEQILLSYASPSLRPQDDLSMMAHALANLTLLIKGPDPLRLGANEEFAAALRGKNRAQLRFLPDSHPAFNSRSQLVDRWQTPLFFHALSHDRIDIRSAGPDRTLWTDDDLHRRYDGQFLADPALSAASLFDAAPSR